MDDQSDPDEAAQEAIFKALELDMDQTSVERLGAVLNLLPETKFEIREYESLAEMEAYSREDGYILTPEKPGICFGFAIEEEDSNYNAQMFYSDSRFIDD